MGGKLAGRLSAAAWGARNAGLTAAGAESGSPSSSADLSMGLDGGEAIVNERSGTLASVLDVTDTLTFSPQAKRVSGWKSTVRPSSESLVRPACGPLVDPVTVNAGKTDAFTL